MRFSFFWCIKIPRSAKHSTTIIITDSSFFDARVDSNSKKDITFCCLHPSGMICSNLYSACSNYDCWVRTPSCIIFKNSR